jgi:small-conductance mechanosensitive channel
MDTLIGLLPPAGVVVGLIVAAFLIQKLLARRNSTTGYKQFNNQLIKLILTAAGALLLVIVLPINEALRGQLLGLLGIVLGASIALASTTLLGNALAALMLQATRSFRIGDFIQTGDHFGRVTEHGLFHTEIQTEDRELTTLPNLYLVTHPVTTTRPSGAIVSATVSLGYDLPRKRIEKLLLDAAARAGLEEPFFQIVDLGDFSVTYRVAGLFKDVKYILTARSRLREAMMDALHEDRIEIVSPVFHNQRRLTPDQSFIPEPALVAETVPSKPAPETVVFDKAEEAQDLESLRSSRDELYEQIKALEERIKTIPKGPERDRAQNELSMLQSREKAMAQIIADRTAKADDAD